jgi:hypothetical protein
MTETQRQIYQVGIVLQGYEDGFTIEGIEMKVYGHCRIGNMVGQQHQFTGVSAATRRVYIPPS